MYINIPGKVPVPTFRQGACPHLSARCLSPPFITFHHLLLWYGESMIHRVYKDENVPALGFGTYQLEGESCASRVAYAIECGYRHIDTAEAYENEKNVAEGIRASGMDRKELFLVSKVWMDNLEHDALIKACEQSLKRLDTDYLDLYLIHWPSESVPIAESLGAMAKLRERGLIRHAGVSNFTRSLLEEALATGIIPIMTNQYESHPYLSQTDLTGFCRERGVLATAYRPIGKARIFDDPDIRAIAETHNKTPAQVILRWHMQREGVLAIPRSSSETHIRENFDIFDFTLRDEDMDRMYGLNRNKRQVDPSFAPDW